MKKYIWLGIIIFIIGFCFYEFNYFTNYYINNDPTKLVEKNLTIDAEEIDQPFTILQISDIHLGTFLNNEDLQVIVDEINKSDYDMVIFTGDLLESPEAYYEAGLDPNETSQILSQLKTDEKYAVRANSNDPSNINGYNDYTLYNQIMTDAGFYVIDDLETVQTGIDNVTITGVEGFPESPEAISGTEWENVMIDEQLDDEDFNIIATHYPDNVNYYKSDETNLFLSGHSHGGQVYLPFYGDVVKVIGAKEYSVDDYYFEDTNTTLNVSTGIGYSEMKLRIGMPPSYTIVTVK